MHSIAQLWSRFFLALIKHTRDVVKFLTYLNSTAVQKCCRYPFSLLSSVGFALGMALERRYGMTCEYDARHMDGRLRSCLSSKLNVKLWEAEEYEDTYPTLVNITAIKRHLGLSVVSVGDTKVWATIPLSYGMLRFCFSHMCP